MPTVSNRLRLLVLIPLARLRFLFILGAIALLIMKWDYVAGWYEKQVHSHEADNAAGDSEFFCPMHPNVVRETNKEKCPICFMPLSKRKKGTGNDEPLPAGTVSRVQLSPYRILLAGVRTTPVVYQPLTKEIVTVGTVEFDERSLKNVSSRIKGRLEKLFVNQTGQLVKKREPLALIYSPDLVVTVENLLNARKTGNADLERDATQRLKLWGIDDEEIQQIIKDGKTITHLTIRSPIDGHVLKKYQREGQYVEEGGMLYDLADISTVWVQAQLYEDDLAFLPKDTHSSKTGLADRKLKVTATARSFPGRTFEGALSFVFPHLDQENRTLSVRFELANQDHELRPGMSATVHIKLDAPTIAELPAGRGLSLKDGKVLAVRDTALIDTGTQKFVYREEVPGTYSGVVVQTGPRMIGFDGEVFYPVLSGLKEKDNVVASGSFLIDAETRLSSGTGSTYIGGSSSSKTGPMTVRPTTPENSEANISKWLDKLSPDDRRLAVAQKFCPVLPDTRLGSMGVPVKVMVEGKPVFLCCSRCKTDDLPKKVK